MLVTRRILLALAVLAGTAAVAAPSSARPLAEPASGTAVHRASGSFHAFAGTGFSGLDRWFSGNAGSCVYVGDNWNDGIRSARTESGTRVELWDNYNCTGGSIVIDRTGYNSIGKWVSAYRVSG